MDGLVGVGSSRHGPMSLPLEAPHTLPSASGPISPLPSCKQTAPLSPLFASLTKSAHPIDSTPLTGPLFSTTCALFRALCKERNAISFLFNRFRALCEKHRGVGVVASLTKGGGAHLSPLELILTQKQGGGGGGPHQHVTALPILALVESGLCAKDR